MNSHALLAVPVTQHSIDSDPISIPGGGSNQEPTTLTPPAHFIARALRRYEMNGFFAVYYTGLAGNGNAVLVIREGTVIGADANGGIYDGRCSSTAGDSVHLEVSLKVSAGTLLVTGHTVPAAHSYTIKADLPAGSVGQPVMIDTPLGPVNVVFRKLRGAP